MQIRDGTYEGEPRWIVETDAYEFIFGVDGTLYIAYEKRGGSFYEITKESIPDDVLGRAQELVDEKQ